MPVNILTMHKFGNTAHMHVHKTIHSFIFKNASESIAGKKYLKINKLKRETIRVARIMFTCDLS